MLSELDVVKLLWNKFSKTDEVYVVVLRKALPFIEDPKLTPQGDYIKGKKREGLILAFLNEAGAQNYKELLPEIHEDLRPSDLAVGKYSIETLFSMTEELVEISKGEYGHPCRIEIALQLENEVVVADTLFSIYQPKH